VWQQQAPAVIDGEEAWIAALRSPGGDADARVRAHLAGRPACAEE